MGRLKLLILSRLLIKKQVVFEIMNYMQARIKFLQPHNLSWKPINKIMFSFSYYLLFYLSPVYTLWFTNFYKYSVKKIVYGHYRSLKTPSQACHIGPTTWITVLTPSYMPVICHVLWSFITTTPHIDLPLLVTSCVMEDWCFIILTKKKGKSKTMRLEFCLICVTLGFIKHKTHLNWAKLFN